MGTPGRATSVGHESYLQAGWAIPLIQEPDVMKNKAGKMLNGVQNSLNFQLHRWSRFRWFSFLFNSQTKRSRRDQRCLFSFPVIPPRRFELKRATGRALEPLARARLRSNNSTPIPNTSPVPYAFYPQIVLQTRNFVLWYSANAFGGTNYSNTPIGAVSHTDEPNASNVNDPGIYFGFWEIEKNFAICAWNSRRTPNFQAVGDPFVTR
jgi:hypothetical protein